MDIRRSYFNIVVMLNVPCTQSYEITLKPMELDLKVIWEEK